MNKIQRSLKYLCDSFDELKQYNKSTDAHITELISIIKYKDERIAKLEAQVNDFEQNGRSSGLLITNLSDHLPVYQLMEECFHTKKKREKNIKVKRITDENILKYKDDLSKEIVLGSECKLWFTSGLRNCCVKNNSFIRYF